MEGVADLKNTGLGKKGTGIICTVGSAVLFGITPVLAKELTLLGCSGAMVVFLRNFFSCVILAAIITTGKKSFAISKRQFCHILWIAFVGQAVAIILLYESYTYIPVGMSTTLHFLYPLFVYLILIIGFRQKVAWYKILALLAATAGIFFFVDKGEIAGAGIYMALLSGVCFSAYIVGIEKTGLTRMNSFVLAFYLALWAAIFSGIYAAAAGEFHIGLPLKGYVYAIGVALGTSVFASVLLQKGISLVGAGLAAVFSMFEPVTSLIAGAVIYGERLNAAKVVGCILILGAATVIAVEKKGRPVSPDT